MNGFEVFEHGHKSYAEMVRIDEDAIVKGLTRDVKRAKK